MMLFYKYRRAIGFASLLSGVLASLTSLLFVADDVGLCEWSDYKCKHFYENLGAPLFLTFIAIFIIGTLLFVHTKPGAKKLRRFSVVVGIIGLLVYFTADTSSGGWTVSISQREVIGWPITVLYSTYILVLATQELLGEKLNFIKRIGLVKLFLILLVIILGVWIAVGRWL